MKIALISDTHDNMERLAQALEFFAQASAEVLIHAGDFTSVAIARKLSTFNGPIHAVFGNTDYENDQQGLSRVLKSIADAPITFELDGRSFVLAHEQPHIPDELLGQADVAVVGHTHQQGQSSENGTLIINPGKCADGAIALLDSQDLCVELITLP